MQLYIEVIADTNDADYITERTEITREEIEYILPVIKAIKECKAHYNWPKSDYRKSDPYELYKDSCTEDQIEAFSELCPHGEQGIHTIESVNILEIAKETQLL
jgi:hypothetical protein